MLKIKIILKTKTKKATGETFVVALTESHGQWYNVRFTKKSGFTPDHNCIIHTDDAFIGKDKYPTIVVNSVASVEELPAKVDTLSELFAE